MRRLYGVLVLGVLVGLIAGCGGETGKGINKDKDKPKPVENAPS
jgi:hypothetical protein